MPTTLTNGIQLPDKGSVDWYNSMQSNYNLIDTHLGNTDTHVTAEDKANWNSKQGSLSQAQLDAIAQVATNTDDIATLQSGKADASHTHSSSDITDIGDYATKQYVDNSISGLVDNAPDALNTLNELSAALNDDANFASTVTTALATKANSADLATVATSGSYDDLTDTPTIPTNTSDLTNDSNFVDTSNPAVSSGITSAKVTSYDSHIADTDIHVTTADKAKWNNGVTQSYVFRYSSTALVASSTNSNALLDNTDNLKVGDKVIDSSGVLFSITAIDTANSTFTIGTALVDLATDGDVVHKSGNETVGGVKTFSNDIRISKTSPFCNVFSSGYIKGQAPTSNIYSGVRFFDDINSGSTNTITGGFEVEYNRDGYNKSYIASRNYAGENHKFFTVGLRVPNDDIRSIDFLPSVNGIVNLGTPDYKWKTLNGLEPSSLGMPDISNGIDISSYITTGTIDNSYTPPANGWIWIKLIGQSQAGASIIQGDWGINARTITSNITNDRLIETNLAVSKDIPVIIRCVLVTDVVSAKFYPCLGNV